MKNDNSIHVQFKNSAVPDVVRFDPNYVFVVLSFVDTARNKLCLIYTSICHVGRFPFNVMVSNQNTAVHNTYQRKEMILHKR